MGVIRSSDGLLEFIQTYGTPDGTGGVSIKVTEQTGIDNLLSPLTLTDPAGGRMLKVTIVGGGGGSSITVVANYAALPDPTTVSGHFYWCEASQGTWWLPGSLGGTYYPSGLYYSNGVAWGYMDTPYQATQAQVNAGVNNDTFVTPLTLRNTTQWDEQDLQTVTDRGYATTNPLFAEFFKGGYLNVGITVDGSYAISGLILGQDEATNPRFVYPSGNMFDLHFPDNGTDREYTLPDEAITIAGITQSLTNGDTTKAPSSDAVFDALALKAPLASPTFTGTPAAPTATAGTNTTQLATTEFVQTAVADTILPNNVSAGTTVTGTTSNTFSKALSVPDGTFEAEKAFFIQQGTVKTGTAGTLTMRFYANATADLSGSPILLGTSTAVGATGRSGFLQRSLRIYTLDGSGSGTETINTTFASLTDWQITPTTAVSNSAVDWSTYVYICVSIQLSNAADSAFCSFISVSR